MLIGSHPLPFGRGLPAGRVKDPRRKPAVRAGSPRGCSRDQPPKQGCEQKRGGYCRHQPISNRTPSRRVDFAYASSRAFGSRRLSASGILSAYTTAPSNRSSTGALVSEPKPREWPSLFGIGFGLRCFQPLSEGAWLSSMPYRTTGTP